MTDPTTTTTTTNAVPRAWASRAGLVAVVVIATQLLWRAIVLGRGFFSQDDFLAMSATSSRHGWDVLSSNYAGGFSPAGSLVVRLCVEVAPLGWPLAVGVALALQAAATSVLWLVLTHVLGDRWLRVPLLVLFAFSPLTLWSTQWWVLGVELWGGTLFLLLAAWALLVGSRAQDLQRAALAVPAFALAVLFDERLVSAPLLLVGVVALAGTAPPDTTARARVADALRGLAPVWVALLAVLGGYAVLRWQVAPLPLDLGDDLGDVVTNYLRHGLAELFGGPWFGTIPGHAYLVPPPSEVALSGALLLGLVGVTLQHGGPAARVAWGTVVVSVAASVGVLALTGRADLTASLGLVHRFAAELAVLFAVGAAGALRDVAFPDLRSRGRWWTPDGLERIVTVVAVVAFTVSTAISTAFLAGNLLHRDDRAYVEHLRSALRADRQVVLLDSGVPDGVISAWYGARAKVSTVVGYAPENPVFDLPSHTLRMVRDDGTLARVELDGPVRSRPSEDEQCGYPVRSDGTLVPLQQVVPDGRWVLRIGYYTNEDGYAVLRVADQDFRFAVRSGLNAVDVVVNGSFTNFRMTLQDSGTTLCLTDASVGVPRPASP